MIEVICPDCGRVKDILEDSGPWTLEERATGRAWKPCSDCREAIAS